MTSLPPRPRRPFGGASNPDEGAEQPRRPFSFTNRRPEPQPAPEEEPVSQSLPDFLTDQSDELGEEVEEGYAEPEVEYEELDYDPAGTGGEEPATAEEYPQYTMPDNRYATTVYEEVEAVPAADAPEAETYDNPQAMAEEEELNDIIAELGEENFRNAQELLRLIANDTSTEVLLNGPHSIMFKENGNRFYVQNISFPSVEIYHKVINHFILPYTSTNERIGEGEAMTDMIEGQLELADLDDPENNPPLKARVHIMAPQNEPAFVTIAKKARRQFTIDELQHSGSMTVNMANFLKALARGRATVVFSGVSGSGKTTLLAAMSHEFDDNDRVIVIEDLPELELPLADVVPLRSTSQKANQDISKAVTLDWLVRQANRMRGDRIVVGEVRGGEMADFLSAANSGADGSMTTVHANSPADTITRIVGMSLRNPGVKTEDIVLRDISSTVHVIVQMTVIDGKHKVTEITEVSNTVTKAGTVALQPVFQYDRISGTHKVVGRASDGLQAYLAQRGVAVDSAWFAGRGM